MSMNPRLNRLQGDYKRLQELAARSPFVNIEEIEGTPPNKYQLRLTCKGITHIASDGSPVYSENHKLRIYLPDEYPREAPQFQMFSPVWHPNIAQAGLVCIGDAGDHGYAPSMGLDDLVVRIIEIIRYENIGLNSAFNLFAADWAANHLHLFPLDNRQILQEEISISILDEIAIVNLENGAIDPKLLNDINIL